jgi:hypothetical protein
MYDIGDEDLAKSYDPKKVAKSVRTPKLPDVDAPNLECLLKRVKKDRAPNAGNLYEFKFQVVKSSTELVTEGGTYTVAFFPGASDVKNSIFWEKITPFLMAVAGCTNIYAFNAAEQLAELKGLCDKDENLELDLPFRMSRKIEPARINKKTGQYDPKHVNADGTPKKYPNDSYFVAAASPQATA